MEKITIDTKIYEVDLKIYGDFSPDLRQLSESELRKHFIMYGYKEHRPYNYESLLDNFKKKEFDQKIISDKLHCQDAEIAVMQASKFWKLRDIYLRSKWALFHPYKFVKKHFFKKVPFLRDKKVALYIASNGNYFFKEILLIIKEGFLELGYTVSVKDESDEFGGDYDWHVVVAPHEFFFIGDGSRFRDGIWPERTIIVNLEQPHLYWFQLVKQCLAKAYAVWDINLVSQKILAQEHSRVFFLPLGYSPATEIKNTIMSLPCNQSTETLDPNSLKGDFLKRDLRERPIDICFIGVLSGRRDTFFAQHASVFSKYNCYFYFWHGKQPMITGKNTAMDTATVQGIVQRSKILVNIHQGEEPYFEWHRIVNQGIANRTLVVSETCTDGGEFISGEDFISSDLGHMIEMIEQYLGDSNLEKAQEIVNRAYDKFTHIYRMKNVLNDILKKIS